MEFNTQAAKSNSGPIVFGIIVILFVIGYLLNQSLLKPLNYYFGNETFKSEPTVTRPPLMLFLAVDLKCASEYEDADQRGGVEGRQAVKKIASVCGEFSYFFSVRLLQRHGRYYQISTESMQEGWVHARHLKLPGDSDYYQDSSQQQSDAKAP